MRLNTKRGTVTIMGHERRCMQVSDMVMMLLSPLICYFVCCLLCFYIAVDHALHTQYILRTDVLLFVDAASCPQVHRETGLTLSCLFRGRTTELHSFGAVAFGTYSFVYIIMGIAGSCPAHMICHTLRGS